MSSLLIKSDLNVTEHDNAIASEVSNLGNRLHMADEQLSKYSLLSRLVLISSWY